MPTTSILQAGMTVFFIEGHEGDLSPLYGRFLPIEWETATPPQDSYFVFFQDNSPKNSEDKTSALQRGYFYPCYGAGPLYLTRLTTPERMAFQLGRHARYDWPENGLMAYAEGPDKNILIGIEHKDNLCPILSFESFPVDGTLQDSSTTNLKILIYDVFRENKSMLGSLSIRRLRFPPIS